LADAIDDYLSANRELLERIETAPITKNAGDDLPADLQIEDCLEEPPAGIGPHQSQHHGTPAKIDWAARDEANRNLGVSGEEFVAN